MTVEGLPAPPRSILRPRQAPEVTRTWPPDGPAPSLPRKDRWVLLATLAAPLATFLATLARLGPLGALHSAVLAAAVTFILADWAAGLHRSPSSALHRARTAVLFGEDPRRVLARLRGVEAAGRAATCLAIARRCLEEAGRSERLAARLRAEAVRWLERGVG